LIENVWGANGRKDMQAGKPTNRQQIQILANDAIFQYNN
jgi:hypothetical protein